MKAAEAVLAAIQAPTVEVRNGLGDLIGRVDRAGVTELIERKWADPVGKRALKYLRLRDNAPWKPLRKTWRGGSSTTTRVRSDGRSGNYAAGQVLGWERNVEHKRIYE